MEKQAQYVNYCYYSQPRIFMRFLHTEGAQSVKIRGSGRKI